jgi:hypothetical protein
MERSLSQFWTGSVFYQLGHRAVRAEGDAYRSIGITFKAMRHSVEAFQISFSIFLSSKSHP